MFTAEIRINGVLISHVYGRNLRELPSGITEYEFECYTIETRRVRKGTVQHLPREGIEVLVAKILNPT